MLFKKKRRKKKKLQRDCVGIMKAYVTTKGTFLNVRYETERASLLQWYSGLGLSLCVCV